MNGILFRLLLISVVIGIASATAFSQFTWYYSAGDSTIYAQYPYFGDYFTFRFREHGAVIERTIENAPGFIVTSSRVPGSVLANQFWTRNYFWSEDFGETWTIRDSSSSLHWDCAQGRAGEQADLGWLQCWDDHDWTYHSMDGWQTYDSNYVAIPDSIGFLDFSYQDGLIYGYTYHTGGRICVSSDTGHTWSIGSPDTVGGFHLLRAGVPDELWGIRYNPDGLYTYLLSDTGRTADSIFAPNLPQRAGDWECFVLPTDEPGEVYFVAAWASMSPAGEFVIYHISEYGAQVDSFHYYCPDFELPHSVQEPQLPDRFQIQVFPNPFNPSTTISFSLPHSQHTLVSVYDLTGRKVSTLADEILNAGEHSVTFDASGLPSGIYFARLTAGSQMRTQKMVLLK